MKIEKHLLQIIIIFHNISFIFDQMNADLAGIRDFF